jgi:hypothetical protein
MFSDLGDVLFCSIFSVIMSSELLLHINNEFFMCNVEPEDGICKLPIRIHPFK